MKLARLSLVGIAILCIALVQQRDSPTTTASALELSGLNDTKNGSVAINSSSSSFLPDPSNCDSAEATAMNSFFFANLTRREQLMSADTVNGQLASDFIDAQNSTHHLQHIAIAQNLSDCQNVSTSPSDNNSSLEEQNDHLVSKGTTRILIADLPSTSMKDSVEVMVLNDNDGTGDGDDDDDDVVLVNVEQISSAIPSYTPTTHIAARHISDARKHLDDVFFINKRKLSGPTPPPIDSSGIHTAAQRSVAKESVEIMDLTKEDLVFIDAEQLGRQTPPPGSPSIHTAARSSLARESVEVMDVATKHVTRSSVTRGSVQVGMGFSEDDVFCKQMAGHSDPQCEATDTATTHSSILTEPAYVMVIEDEDVVLVDAERLGRATPPPVDTTIHTAGQRSTATESVQVMVMSDDDMIVVKEERLGRATPPPISTGIHTASQSSVARDLHTDVSPPFHHHDDINNRGRTTIS